MQKAVKSASILSYMLKPLTFSHGPLKIMIRYRRSSLIICVTLGYGKSGGAGEDPSVHIFILRPENIRKVFSIQHLWTTLQVTYCKMLLVIWL